MADKISPERRSENMRQIKSKGMKPEMIVRKLAHSLGYRYRLHKKELPGKPDLVFSSRRKAIFVNGCFWHQHNDPFCKDSKIPSTRQEYWIPKLSKNKQRDEDVRISLEILGWDVLTIWECETADTRNIANKLKRFLSG